jgi:hypothetical protein
MIRVRMAYDDRIHVVESARVFFQNLFALPLCLEAAVNDDLRMFRPNLQAVAAAAGSKGFEVETHGLARLSFQIPAVSILANRHRARIYAA